MLHDINSELTPVAHRNLNGSSRVAMWVRDNEYAVVVAKNHVRIFDENTLPDQIKALISMIHAFPPNILEEWESDNTTVYINHQDLRLDDIGWQVTKHLYILVLDNQFVKSLYGHKE
jgi:3-isopropylmalate dehydratase small subunit